MSRVLFHNLRHMTRDELYQSYRVRFNVADHYEHEDPERDQKVDQFVRENLSSANPQQLNAHKIVWVDLDDLSDELQDMLDKWLEESNAEELIHLWLLGIFDFQPRSDFKPQLTLINGG